jgi:NAD(P)-dependent dehydrogenase (short-subunit alcohol dehydrogenase family)
MKETDMGKLEGKIALITGGNSGIGLATAKQFVHEGAYVFITGRREPELAAAVKEIGSHVTGVHGDVSNLGDLDRLFTHIKREKGKLDSVFANAGVATYAPFGEITEEHYDAIFTINVKGLLFTVQKALPLLPDGASIILNASIVASKGLPASSVEFITVYILWYAVPPLKGGTTYGQCTIYRCAGSSHRVSGFHRPDPGRVSAPCPAF